MDILEIEIVFENCQVVTIKKSQMFGFYMRDITERVTLYSNALLVYKHAGESYLSLRWDLVKDIIVDKNHFEQKLGDRLKSNDITRYVLHTTDDNSIEIDLPWGDNDYKNTKETHSLIDGVYIIEHKD